MKGGMRFFPKEKIEEENLWICICLFAQYTGLLGLIKSKKTMTGLSWFQLRSLAFEVLENSISSDPGPSYFVWWPWELL